MVLLILISVSASLLLLMLSFLHYLLFNNNIFGNLSKISNQAITLFKQVSQIRFFEIWLPEHAEQYHNLQIIHLANCNDSLSHY